MVCNRIPSLDMKGDQILAFNRLCALRDAGHQISLIYFSTNDAKEDIASKLIQSMDIAIVKVPKSIFSVMYNFFIALLKKQLPFQCAIYSSRAFKEMVKKIINDEKVDAIHCITVRVMENIPSNDKKLWIDFVDSLAFNFYSRKKETTSKIFRLLFDIEHSRLLAYEKKFIKLADKSFIVSSKDRDYLGSKELIVNKLGLDLSIYQNERKPNKNNMIIFTGNMSYYPNVNAVIWFIKNCWKDIQENYPELKFYVVGRDPAKSIRNLAKKENNIFVTGSVNSISNIICKSSLSIAPMQAGSGMQLKILEAMACSVPVITTSKGLGDIDAKIDKEIVIADNAEMFIQKIKLLLDNKELNHKIGVNGKNYLLENHCRNRISSKFINAINKQ